MTSIQRGFSDDFLNIMQALINYYIHRQHLVMLAMLDVNPRWLSSKVLGFNIRPYIEKHDKKQKKRLEMIVENKNSNNSKLEPIIWKHDWDCFPHGNGCRLTHLHTGEPIEWDAPDPNVFDIGWFIHHLQWRFENEQEDPYIHMCIEWFNGQTPDDDTILQAIYWLIEKNRFKLRQDNRCIVNSSPNNKLTDLSKDVIQAAYDLMHHYHKRQQIAVQAMVELRPDFIIEIAEASYTLPETVQELTTLYQHLDTQPAQGNNIQSGVWKDDWEYDIRYGTCTLMNISTSEPIRWSVSNPELIDYHGFISHLQWRIDSQPGKDNILSILKGLHEHVRKSYPTPSQQEVKFASIHTLWGKLIESGVVVLRGNKRGSLIKLSRTD